MSFSLGIVGAGQFAGDFAMLFDRHPGIDGVWATDVEQDRAAALVDRHRLRGTIRNFDDMLRSPEIEAVAIFTQRWTHAPLVVRALRAGKHVYSAVPMGISVAEVAAIVEAVEETGLVYMMGETSFYNPATVLARSRQGAGEFGRLFYAEGDYIHDMDLGFYDAYRYSGGAAWRSTASFPPLLYPTHSIGGVLGAWETHATKAVAFGVRDEGTDGVFDRAVSMFDNDVSNATALFELAGGGSLRINEFRRVGYPSSIRESRFRFFGTKASFEQVATAAFWYTRDGAEDVSALLSVHDGTAIVQDRHRLPAELRRLPDGHEGTHHFLADDFVRAVSNGTSPPIDAWRAARFTLPGIIAHESARRDGERLSIPDFGDGPPR